MEKGKPGRKRKLAQLTEDEYKQISQWSGDGLNESQIATLLNVNISTITREKKRNEQFAEAIKRGKGRGIQRVTNKLYEKALEGDNTAMIFYLKNRAGWQDKIEKETIIEQKQVIDLTRISNNELSKLKSILTSVTTEGGSRGNEEIIEGVHEKLLGSD